MLNLYAPWRMAVFFARIVMPRSRSSGFESITRVLDGLPLAEDAALLEHGVDQRRLPVVDVGDDGDVTYVGTRTHVLHYSTRPVR